MSTSTGPAVARDVLLGALVLAVVAGLLWSRLAPEVPVRVVEGGGAVVEGDPGRLFARQAVLGLLLGAAGAVLGAAAYARHRRRGALASVLLVLAGLAGALVAARVGELAGPAAPGSGLAVGTQLVAPLAVDVPGMLLLWPIASLAVVLVANSAFPPRTSTAADPEVGGRRSG